MKANQAKWSLLLTAAWLAFILLLVLAATGCGPPMTRKEKQLFALMVGASAADAYTTIEATEIDSRGGHFHELNPILGEHPDAGNVILFKAAVTGVL